MTPLSIFKKDSLDLSRILFFAFALFSFSLSAQTPEQYKNFLNRSHVTIMKVQKEMMRSGQKTYEDQLKEAIKYQLAAIKLYDQNKLKEAISYSYNSRSGMLDVLTKLFPPAVNGLSFNEEEKVISKDAGSEKLQLKISLTKTEEEQIDQLDVLDYQKIRTIVLNAK